MVNRNTGYVSPTLAGTISFPGAVWVCAQNIGSHDSAMASISASMSAGNPVTDYLIAAGFNFNLPTNISAQGVELVYWHQGGGSQYDVKTCALGLVSGVNVRGQDQGDNASWVAVGDTPTTVGGPTNLFGMTGNATLSAGMLNSQDFGIYLAAVVSGTGFPLPGGSNIAVDAFTLRIYYDGPYIPEVISSEYGYEQRSVSFTLTKAVDSSEYGYEQRSININQNPKVVHSQYGYESFSPALVQHYSSQADRWQMGTEIGSAHDREMSNFGPSFSDYGFEAFSPIASRHPFVDARTCEFGFEAKSVLNRYFQYGNSSVYGRRIQREF